MRPLLSLVMMVRNESSSIREILEAAKPFVDTWCILDTESTDDTRGIILDAMKDKPGQLYIEPFEDFATTRNRILDLHEKMRVPDDRKGFVETADFVLFLSGDEYLHDGDALRQFLEIQRNTDTDCFKVRLLIDETRFDSPRVFRTGSNWRYEGKVHEVPYNRADPEAKTATVPTTTIEHIVSDHEKRFANIWENHIPLLESELEENPNDERTLIFLAASYEALLPMMEPGERVTYAMRAMSLYLRRLALPTPIEAERNYLKLRYLMDARMTGVYNEEEIFIRCKELSEADPHRPETALMLVHAAVAAKLPAKQVYRLAACAANVAAAATDINSDSPVSTTCEWEARLIAMKAAQLVSDNQPGAVADDQGTTYAALAAAHMAAGIAAGGDPELFTPTVQPVSKTTEPQQEAVI